MNELRTGVTIVGGGIAGLWSAKELLDQGLSVDLVEKSPYLAAGATTRNEGWLHAGTYHSVAIYDEHDARNVVDRTVYGHDAILDFAPESIEHEATYAFTQTDEQAHAAVQRWDQFGIPYQEVPVRQFAGEGFDLGIIRTAFQVRDKSVNSRQVCAKLAGYITEHGGRIHTNANFVPTSSTTADMVIGDETHHITADQFLITAGTGTKRVFETITGQLFPMRYFKSHLLVTPRLTEHNYFYMEPFEAGIMSHGGASIVGINREAVEVIVPDYEVLADKDQLVYDALLRMAPSTARLDESQRLSIACVKADVADSSFRQASVDPTVVLQDLNIKVFEPTEGYICAIPGKMTEGPALAKAVVNYILGEERHNPNPAVGRIPEQSRDTPDKSYDINLRPADQWLDGQEIQEG